MYVTQKKEIRLMDSPDNNGQKERERPQKPNRSSIPLSETSIRNKRKKKKKKYIKRYRRILCRGITKKKRRRSKNVFIRRLSCFFPIFPLKCIMYEIIERERERVFGAVHVEKVASIPGKWTNFTMQTHTQLYIYNRLYGIVLPASRVCDLFAKSTHSRRMRQLGRTNQMD